jgi:hypothetical protein
MKKSIATAIIAASLLIYSFLIITDSETDIKVIELS